MDFMDELLLKTPDRQYPQGIRVWDVRTPRGTKAELEELSIANASEEDRTFTIAQGGELLSLQDGSPISASFDLTNGNPLTVILYRPGQCVFLPEGLNVTFNSAGTSYCLNEYPAETVRENFALKIFEHGSEVAKYLTMGTHVSGNTKLEPLIDGNPDTIGCYTYPIEHILHPNGSCNVHVIPNSIEDTVYVGTNEIEVEILEGHGYLYRASFDGTNITIDSFQVQDTFKIDPKSIYRFVSVGLDATVVRKSCPGFKTEHEMTLNEYLKIFDSPEKRGVIDKLVIKDWDFANNPLRNLRSMGR